MIRPLLAAALFCLVGLTGCGEKDDAAKLAKFNRVATAKVENALDDLDATDAQRKEVQGLKDRVISDGAALWKDRVNHRTELVTLWKSEKPDGTRLHALVDERSAAFTAFAHKLADAALEFHRILTPQQRAQVSEKLDNHCH